ncbi:MAG TPA: hypothetical protein VNS61_10830 [Caldimonas sp.]|nr:hypothetical protein [Caldimonas sp.]
MKALLLLAGTMCLAALPVDASASCYYVFSAQNQLVYRSTISPVDLSRPISEGMKGRYAGGHLTMVPDETGCPDLIASSEGGGSAIFGQPMTGGERSISAMDVSPVLRNLKSVGPGTSAYDPGLARPAYDSTRDAARRSMPSR